MVLCIYILLYRFKIHKCIIKYISKIPVNFFMVGLWNYFTNNRCWTVGIGIYHIIMYNLSHSLNAIVI